jgi:hypothetical protein
MISCSMTSFLADDDFGQFAAHRLDGLLQPRHGLVVLLNLVGGGNG